MRSNCCFFIICIIYFSQVPGFSQNQSIKRCRVSTITFEQGLLNNGTSNIITDRSGYTWVSTLSGIQRYNGYTLDLVNPVIGTDTIHITNPVYFFGLKDGSIWISYRNGILSYDPGNKSFKNILSLKTGEHFHFPVIPLYESGGVIWCIKEKTGIATFDHDGKQVDVLPGVNTAETDNIIHSQFLLYNDIFSAAGDFIFIVSGNKIIQVNTRMHKATELSYDIGNIYSVACNTKMFFIISGKGLFAANNLDGKILKKIATEKISGEPLNKGNLFIANGQLLFSVNRHLYESDTAISYIKKFTTLGKDPIVSTGQIQHIYADQFKRIWLLTNDDIKRIQNVDIPFEYFAYPHANNFVRALYYDESKHLLIAGCYNGGIQLYDTLGNPMWEKPIVTNEVKDILGIEKTGPDNYLLVTLGKGWYKLNLSTKKITSYNIKKFGIDPAINLFTDNLQRINDSTLFVTNSANVFSCVFKNGVIRTINPFLPQENIFSGITSFFYSTEKILWAGTFSGFVYRYDGRKIKKIAIPGNYVVRCIAEDSRHGIWVGADKGLYYLNIEGEIEKQFSRDNGLRNDCIYGLLPLDSGGVFGSSNLGLSYISIDGIIKNYPKELGLQGNEFNTASAIRSLSGKFYFGGVNGITGFYPSALSLIRDNPVLNITRVVVNDSTLNFSSAGTGIDSVALKYNQNYLRIDVAALGLLNANEYVYHYRLRGFENSWQTTYQPTGINYVLEPGTYTFEVNCSPILSPENIFHQQMVIVISPPWWKTWWFTSLAILLGIAIVVIIIHQVNRRRYLQKIQALQMQQEIQHERERISRDLHDNLGAYASAIASDADAIESSNQNEKNILENLKINASEIMTNLRDTIWALHKEAITITGISDRFKNYIKKIQGAYQEKEITVTDNIEEDKVLSPTIALNVYRIMQEALHNALKHSNASHINISISCSPDLDIKITDDGKGFNADMDKNGFGLQNMKSRAKEINLNLNIENNQNAGTTVNIFL